MAYSTLHWRIVNIMARLFGLMAFGAAIAFAISAARYWANPHLADRIPSASGSAFGDAVGVMIFSLVVGVLFSIVDTFRPDLDRSAIKNDSGGRQKRSWWTGEPFPTGMSERLEAR